MGCKLLDLLLPHMCSWDIIHKWTGPSWVDCQWGRQCSKTDWLPNNSHLHIARSCIVLDCHPQRHSISLEDSLEHALVLTWAGYWVALMGVTSADSKVATRASLLADMMAAMLVVLWVDKRAKKSVEQKAGLTVEKSAAS